MPLTKISTGLVSDSAITGVKINDASIQAVDLATASVTSDKLHTTLNLASHTVTLPENSISNRELNLTFPSEVVKSIKVRVTEGLNPRRQLFLCLKDSREIPLTGVDQPAAPNKIENEAVTLAKYLNVFLETE